MGIKQERCLVKSEESVIFAAGININIKMMGYLYKSILLSACVMLTSCATIVTGTKAKISIDGDINEPLTIVTSYKTYRNQELPVIVEVKRKKLDGQRIKLTSESYEYRDILLRKSINSWTFGNLILGGLVGWSIDLITNCVSTPAQDNFFIEGTPKNKSDESGDER